MVAYSGALAFHYQDTGFAGQLQPSTVANSWHTTAPSTLGHRQSRSSMKRDLSDTDTDDIYDDGSGKGTPTQSTNSCQMLNRKKRRGIIEKKRRDRINNSLTELRRLVPTAFEKQGSAKLEKAEILQMTVDHLKMLHAKGFDAFSFDPHKFAMDYHSIGFRECAAEVARYLVSVEGLDIQDPLRLRLMSHLQCFSTQRDLVTKPAATPTHSSSWNTFSPVQPGALNSSQFTPSTPSATSASTMSTPIPSQHNLQMTSNNLDSVCNSEGNRFQDSSFSSSIPHHMRLAPTTLSSNSHQSATGNNANTPTYHGIPNQSSSLVAVHPHHPFPPQYPVHLNINSGFASMSPSSYSPNASSANTTQVKPYRPWGTELAY